MRTAAPLAVVPAPLAGCGPGAARPDGRGAHRNRSADARSRLVAAVVLGVLLALSPATRAADESPGHDHRSIASIRDCELGYRVFRPALPAAGPAVVLAHGILRNGDYMRGWAEAIADRGLTAVTVDLCAMSAAGGTHADNGRDMVALRRMLGIHQVIYLGVSAGGLAALTAAALDPAATRGLLLLDPVNAGGQARSAAGKVDVPVAALIAKPQVCNAWRNIDPALETLDDATIIAMDDASHCDFEWPSDTFCRVACMATAGREHRERAQARIRAVALGFVQAIAAGEPGALSRWKADIGAHLD